MKLNKKSSLVTADPYHVPGYCGYVPQFKYTMGMPFGKQTHGLLTDRNSTSWRSKCIFTSNVNKSNDRFDLPILPFSENWGNEKYKHRMIPGYTGYIPRKNHYFGSCYSKISSDAVQDFCTERQQYELMKVNSTSKGIIQTPIIPLFSYPTPYPPSYMKFHPMSPIALPNSHPQKFFMSGYTGFVPKSRKYLGEGYPIITKSALLEDAVESTRLKKAKHLPVNLSNHTPSFSHSSLYNTGVGSMPHYTGHVPGEKYKYGMTYGTSTLQAGMCVV